MRWSPQQEGAIASVTDWYRAGQEQIFYLAGYAGTGKTTIARHLVDSVDAKPCYAAYTGKAAQVMRNSGCDDAGTLHSKIYKFKRKNGNLTKSIHRGSSSPIVGSDLIVVDECSMVDEEIGRDLTSFEKPILVLGDPAQLPPVKGGGFFTSRKPDVMLTEIHRQAEGNPIIRLATDVRTGKGINYGSFGSSHVVTREGFRNHHSITDADQVLVGYNKTRIDFNARLRTIEGRETWFPEVKDRLVCLKNDRDTNIFNGGMFTVEYVGPMDGALIQMSVQSEDEPERDPIMVSVREECFSGAKMPHFTELKGSQQFAYGYALTVHKSQGSQWPNVVLFDEAFGTEEERRQWLYTGITRASESIIIVR